MLLNVLIFRILKSGLSNLASLSFRRNYAISAQGLNTFSGLINLVKLDLERCPGIHGSLVHIQGWILYAMLCENYCSLVHLNNPTTHTTFKKLFIRFNHVGISQPKLV